MFWPLDTLWLVTGGSLVAALLVALRPAQPGSRLLVITLACIASATFCYSMGLLAKGYEAKLFWNRAEYATEPYVAALVLLLVLRHVRFEFWLRPAPLALIFCVPALATLANWTNDWHHLYYQSISLNSDTPGVYLTRVRGPLFWFLHAHVLGTLVLAIGLLVQHRQRASRSHRRGSRALLLAAGMLLVLDLLHLTGLGWTSARVMPYLGTSVVVALVSWGFLRWRWLDLSLLARGALLEHMAEAVVVLDHRGRITDFNQRAADWLGCSDAAYAQPAARLSALAWFRPDTPSGEQASRQLGTRLVRFLITPLRSRGGRLAGWLLLGRDDTLEHAAQAALQQAHDACARNLQRALAQSVRLQEEEQRRLGHEIHDSLCQELAGLCRCADQLAAGVWQPDSPEFRQQAAVLARETSRILKATRTLAHDLALTDLGFLSFEESLAEFSTHAENWLGIHWLGIQLETNLDEEVAIHDKELACVLLRIIREAVVNAVRHGHAQRVWVDVVRKAGQLAVSVSNNGLPLPPAAELREGLGLRQMRMRSQLLGGRLSLRNQPSGCVVMELTVPEAFLSLPAEERISEAQQDSPAPCKPHFVKPQS